MTQVVKGVLYLHSHGILHRDLTLGNILLTRGMDAVSLNHCTIYLYLRSTSEIQHWISFPPLENC